MISFQCNICGHDNSAGQLHFDEAGSCTTCGSNVRHRALIHLLSCELFGRSFMLPHFPRVKAIKALGLSDQLHYAEGLAEKFDYLNTNFDRHPRFDITETHPAAYGTYDLIVSADVFEHIPPPVARAFDEACRLLKPNGVLCGSVPFSLLPQTLEHFPNLHDYAVIDLKGSLVLVNRRRDGALEVHGDLVFHAADGPALEMRVFSQEDLRRKFLEAGFRELKFQTEDVPEFGIVFGGQQWSVPFFACKDEFIFNREAGRELCQYQEALHRIVDRRDAELAERGEWTLRLDSEVKERDEHIRRLQSELEESNGWALRQNAELEEREGHIRRLQSELAESNRWALQLQARVAQQETQLRSAQLQIASAGESRWMKLGKMLRVGPRFHDPG